MSPLLEWQNFYVIIGSAAGGLTGLQFVVMALIADMPLHAHDGEAAEAFATPTIVHFVAVLMLAASVVIPWHGLLPAAIAWGASGFAGVIYTAIVVRRMSRQAGYSPVAEDWVFHALLPAAAYLGILLAAVFLQHHTRGALFGIAGTALLLLAVGIHNAWDNITHIVFLRGKRERAGIHLPPPR